MLDERLTQIHRCITEPCALVQRQLEVRIGCMGRITAALEFNTPKVCAYLYGSAVHVSQHNCLCAPCVGVGRLRCPGL